MVGQFTIPVRLCDECYDLAQMRNKMQSYVYEVRRLMALLPPEEGAMFRQEITIALDEGARYRAEQTVMLEEARANARRAADSWSRRSTFSGNLPSRAGMRMLTPPSERRRRSHASSSDHRSSERYERIAFENHNYNSANNRETTSSIDSVNLESAITLDVSTI